MKIIPLYRFEDLFLMGWKADFSEKKLLDTLVVEIDIKKKKIVNPPWSCQKMLKFGYYYPIETNERESFYELINKELGEIIINDIENMLSFPLQESVDSLIWKAERFRVE